MGKESEKKLSTLMEESAISTREIAESYREGRNIYGIGIAAVTLMMNSFEHFEPVPTAEQLKLNIAGLAVAGLTALGMEHGRQKRLKRAEYFDELATELTEYSL